MARLQGGGIWSRGSFVDHGIDEKTIVQFHPAAFLQSQGIDTTPYSRFFMTIRSSGPKEGIIEVDALGNGGREAATFRFRLGKLERLDG